MEAQSRAAIRKRTTRLVGATYAYLEFEEKAPRAPLTPVQARQRAVAHRQMWEELRDALDELYMSLVQLQQ